MHGCGSCIIHATPRTHIHNHTHVHTHTHTHTHTGTNINSTHCSLPPALRVSPADSAPPPAPQVPALPRHPPPPPLLHLLPTGQGAVHGRPPALPLPAPAWPCCARQAGCSGASQVREVHRCVCMDQDCTVTVVLICCSICAN